MYKLGINFDEISDDIDEAIKVMKDHNVKYGELRTVNKKNFIFWSDQEIALFKKKITKSGIKVIAAATPLFKWYESVDDHDIQHDNFGFNPRLSDNEKNTAIERAINIASALDIPRLRIFSGLGKDENAGITFSKSELLHYALSYAAKHGIALYLENEPVCKVHDKKEIINLFQTVKNKKLKLWLDIANLVEIGEDIDPIFVKQISPHLGYIHIKDFIYVNGQKKYVPAGQGIIDYANIMQMIYEKNTGAMFVTVETHALNNKANMSIAAIMGTRKILETAGIKYE